MDFITLFNISNPQNEMEDELHENDDTSNNPTTPNTQAEAAPAGDTQPNVRTKQTQDGLLVNIVKSINFSCLSCKSRKKNWTQLSLNK